jgi:hypothetical protein
VKLILPALVLSLLSLNPSTLSAQTLQVPRVEVGGHAGLVGAFGCCAVVLFGPRLTPTSCAVALALVLAACELNASRMDASS